MARNSGGQIGRDPVHSPFDLVDEPPFFIGLWIELSGADNRFVL